MSFGPRWNNILIIYLTRKDKGGVDKKDGDRNWTQAQKDSEITKMVKESNGVVNTQLATCSVEKISQKYSYADVSSSKVSKNDAINTFLSCLGSDGSAGHWPPLVVQMLIGGFTAQFIEENPFTRQPMEPDAAAKLATCIISGQSPVQGVSATYSIQDFMKLSEDAAKNDPNALVKFGAIIKACADI